MDMFLWVVNSGLILSLVRISLFFTFGFGDVWMYHVFKFVSDLDFHVFLSLIPSPFTIFNLFLPSFAGQWLGFSIPSIQWYYCLITYFQAQHDSRLIPHEQTKTAFTAIGLDKIAEFFTKTEWKKCKNMQNIFLDGCYKPS